MSVPIPSDRAEEIILYYIELQYLVRRGLAAKIGHPLKIKAQELGMSLRAAWNFISFGRKVGMVDTETYFK